MFKEEAISRLKEWLEDNKRVYTILKHVSRSGMTRHISVKIVHDGEVKDISYQVAKAIGEPMKDGYVKVVGVGMDMGFDLVYRLSQQLYGDGYKLNQEWA